MNNIDDEEQTKDQKIDTTENRCKPTQHIKMNLHDTKKQKNDFNDDVDNHYENNIKGQLQDYTFTTKHYINLWQVQSAVCSSRISRG
eukprot:5759489-Amphidinium_carterae.1